jgi:hypothetical protein
LNYSDQNIQHGMILLLKIENVVIDYFNSSHNNMWYLNITNIKTSPKVTLIYQGTDVLGIIILKRGNTIK